MPESTPKDSIPESIHNDSMHDITSDDEKSGESKENESATKTEKDKHEVTKVGMEKQKRNNGSTTETHNSGSKLVIDAMQLTMASLMIICN